MAGYGANRHHQIIAYCGREADNSSINLPFPAFWVNLSNPGSDDHCFLFTSAQFNRCPYSLCPRHYEGWDNQYLPLIYSPMVRFSTKTLPC